MRINKSKNLGIEVLRIYGVIGIICLHVINNGGISNSLIDGTPTFFAVNVLKALMYTSVNVFGIITGYLYCEKNTIRRRRIINLWGIVLFYSIIITILTIVLHPDYLGDRIQVIRSIFPPIEGRYWFISCYTLLFFLIPYINVLSTTVSEEDFKRLLVISFVFLSVTSTFGFYDYFRINYGYSPFWLLFCYLVGTYFRRNEKQIKEINVSKLCCLITFSIVVASLSEYIFNHTNETMQHYLRSEEWLMQYNSPLIIISAYAIVVLFVKCFGRFENTKTSKVLTWFSASVFSVYIIHSHPIIYDYYIKNAFSFVSNNEAIIAVLIILGVASGIFIICTIIDSIRRLMGLFIHNTFCERVF